jgi:exodeoxyribonuclease-3
MSIVKIATWNIQSGGGNRINDICNYIEKIDVDFITITEFRNKNFNILENNLRNLGFNNFICSKSEDNTNGLLIASKEPYIKTDNHIEFDNERWLEVQNPKTNLKILSLHIPGAPDHKFNNGIGISGLKRKEIFWNNIIHYAEKNLQNDLIILGDFNSGLKEDAQGTPFKLSKYIKELNSLGFIDSWRKLNPDLKEYTYYSKQKVNGITQDYNGFRIDYIYTSPSLSNNLIASEICHIPRNKRISDHSILTTQIKLPE